MGAPAVIAVSPKSYVAINSYKSDRSLTSTMCDLGRVSNLAAAVTLPRSRTSNFVNRNSAIQSVRSLPHKKRPFAEVMGYSNSCHGNMQTKISPTNGADCHKRRRSAISSQSSTSFISTPTTVEANIAREHDSNPQAKVMKLTSQEAEKSSHLQINQHNRVNGLITQKQPGQHKVKLQMSAMGQFPIQHSLAMQLQQQNQQLLNENMQLQKQLSLFRQLMKNPQRLNQVLTRLEQRAQ